MIELCSFVESEGGGDGWSLGLRVELVRDSSFAGVRLEGQKKDHSSHLHYHSHYVPPPLISIAFLCHTTHSTRLHYLVELQTLARKEEIEDLGYLLFPLFLPCSEILQRQPDPSSWWRS
jgi:hypothetical protein